MGLDDRIGPKFLQAGIGFGGLCFPKDVNALKQLAGNSGYHFQLLNAVIEVNELQKRRVIGKLQKHLGSLVGKRDRAARPGVQAEHGRHARGDVARAARAAAGRRRDGRRLRPCRRGRGAQADRTASSSPTAPRRPSTAPTRSCSSPSGTSSRTLDWARSPRRDARRRADRRAQRARPGAVRAAGLATRASAARAASVRRAPRCRRSSSSAARARGCGR